MGSTWILMLLITAGAAQTDNVGSAENSQAQQVGAEPAAGAALSGLQAFLRDRSRASQRDDTLPQKNSLPAGRGSPNIGATDTKPSMPQALASWIVQVASPSAAAALAPPSGDRAALAAAVANPGTDARGRNITAAQVLAQAVDAQITSVAAAAGVSRKIVQRYAYALSGFSIKDLTPAELQALRANPQVVSVTPNKLAYTHTYSSPWFLNLTSFKGQGTMLKGNTPQGLWDRLGGVIGFHGAGEDQIIAIVDTGLWLEDRPSFADRGYWPAANTPIGQNYSPLKAWRGRCDADTAGTPFGCNNKVIGCRYFADFFGPSPNGEPRSCKDFEGHGTHTASTAAGNYGVATPKSPSSSVISGMAPRARLAVYKVLWEGGYGTTADIIAGIEQATIDGVDVISMSFGVDEEYNTLSSPTQLAVMHAAGAGVVVSLAGGNIGPGLSTVSSNAPGAITVAASTLPRSVLAILQLGDGTRFEGASDQYDPLGPFPLIYSGNASASGGVVSDARLCGPGSLNPLVVAGKAVACDRGQYILIDKATEVKRAGGLFMILMDTPTSNQGYALQAYDVPTIHLLVQARTTVINYATKASNAKAQHAGTTIRYDAVAPAMAWWSSRGPVPVANGAVMKPDITAPGADILAPVAGPSSGDPYKYLSGTSMSTPHVAGVAALLKEKHPYWTPMMIKSALMTTAYTINSQGQAFGNALDFGAGHINPEAALNPGLVITSTYNDWMTLTCAAEPRANDPMCMKLCPSALTGTWEASSGKRGPGSLPFDVQRVAASTCPADKVSYDLNGPWVSGNVGGTLIVQRTLTAVLPGTGRVRFTASTSASPGSSFSISVSPQAVTLADGGSATVTIRVSATDGTPLDKYQFGQVVWTSKSGHVVRMPVSVNFKAVLAPAVIAPVNRQPSFTYDFGIRTQGPSSVAVLSTPLQAAQVVDIELSTSEDSPAPSGIYSLEVAADLDFFAAGSFYTADMANFATLYLLDSNFSVVAGPSRLDHNWEMIIEARDLAAGSYLIYAEWYTWDPRNPVPPPFNATISFWQLNYNAPGSAGGLMSVSPNTVAVDQQGVGRLSLSFNGVTMPSPFQSPTRYLGYVGYAKAGSVKPTDATRVSFFFPIPIPDVPR